MFFRPVASRYDRLMALNDERPEKGRDMSEKLKKTQGSVSIVIQPPVVLGCWGVHHTWCIMVLCRAYVSIIFDGRNLDESFV